MTASKLRARLRKHVSDLPVLPQTVVRLMSLDPEADDFFDQLLGVIHPEPAFAARILAMANSAASGALTPITSIRMALSRIGSRDARNLILALAVTRVFVPRDDWEKSLWRHSIHVAVAAREMALLASSSDLDPEEAFVSGLLHDLGRFVLFQEGPEELRKIDEANWGSPEELIALETSICGMTHGELGALACRHWMLPEEITEVVRNHHATLPATPVGALERMTALVQAADLAMFPTAMPGAVGLEHASEEALEQFMEARLSSLFMIRRKEFRSLLATVAKEADEATAGLGLN